MYLLNVVHETSKRKTTNIIYIKSDTSVDSNFRSNYKPQNYGQELVGVKRAKYIEKVSNSGGL